MYEKALLEAGLTQNEVKVYLSLLKLGKSASGKIVRDSKISSGKAYETLHKLIDKGLVKVVIENGIKQFIASDPDAVLLYMKEKKSRIDEQAQALEKIIPNLKQIQQWQQSVEGVFLVKGFRGIRPLVYNLFPKAKGEFKVMGVRSSKDTKYNTFWSQWHESRVQHHKKARMLFSDRDSPYWKTLKTMKFVEVRCITSVSPSAIMIIDDNCFIFSYDDEFTCIHIVSPAIAKSFDSFFESLWTIAKA